MICAEARSLGFSEVVGAGRDQPRGGELVDGNGDVRGGREGRRGGGAGGDDRKELKSGVRR